MTGSAGALEHLLLAQLVDAAVADVCPVGGRILHKAQRTSRSGARFDGEARARLEDVLMRAAEGEMRKPERIENRARCLPEGADQRRERGLSRARTLRMAAHAVDNPPHHRALID